MRFSSITHGLVDGEKPATGRLPGAERLSDALSGIGYAPGRQVVAYDDEGGGHASRLLWTLHVLGHVGGSLLNGGYSGWVAEGLRVHAGASEPAASNYRGTLTRVAVADAEYIRARIDDPGVVILDARSPDEFAGRDRRARRGGHIPGAVNLNWTDTMDAARHRRLHSAAVLRDMLIERGITPGSGSDHLLPDPSSFVAELRHAQESGVSARARLSGLLGGVGQPR